MKTVVTSLTALIVLFVPLSSVAKDTPYVTHTCDNLKRKPASMLLECHFEGGPEQEDDPPPYNDNVTRLEWKQWHAKRAIGRGVFHRNDCDPNCDDGTIRKQRGKLVLTLPRECPNGKKVFKRARALYNKEFLGKDKRFYRLQCPKPLPY
jgi:hypothetical protein